MNNTHYNKAFYLSQKEGSYRSACNVVPIVLSQCPAKSVVDVGCGLGTWASRFSECGVPEVIGIDGSHINPAMLRIPLESFAVRDLRNPVHLNRRFELAVCLEVGEHLPEARSRGLVEDLVALAPCVLFSAALPGQGGTDHINEQYLSSWAKLFAAQEFEVIDSIRPLIWDMPEIDWWYRQNLVFFAHRTHRLTAQFSPAKCLDYIHPELYKDPPLRHLLLAFPAAIRQSIRSRGKRILYTLAR